MIKKKIKLNKIKKILIILKMMAKIIMWKFNLQLEKLKAVL